MRKLEIIKYEKCHTLLREPASAPYFHPLFLNFQILPFGGGNQNLLPPALKKGGESGPNYVANNLYKKNEPQTWSFESEYLWKQWVWKNSHFLKIVKLCFAHKKLFKTINM